MREWRRAPSSATTIALCDELRSSAYALSAAQVDTLAAHVERRFRGDPRVLLALGRLQIACGALVEAEATFLQAARQAPWASGPTLMLGETLLRRGDADGAIRFFERARELARGTADTLPLDGDPDAWLAFARELASLQRSRGEGAVVGAVTAEHLSCGASHIRRRAADPHASPTRAVRPPPALLEESRSSTRRSTPTDAEATRHASVVAGKAALRSRVQTLPGGLAREPLPKR